MCEIQTFDINQTWPLTTSFKEHDWMFMAQWPMRSFVMKCRDGVFMENTLEILMGMKQGIEILFLYNYLIFIE